MATIRKRNWTGSDGEARQAWLVDYRDGAGARRSKQFARKRDAEVWQTRAAWQVSQGVHTPDSQSITVEAAAKLWIARAEAEGRERSTVKQYRELARLHIVPLIGAEKLSRLSMPAVEAFRDSLVASRSRAMAGKAVRALSSILTEAQRRGLVAQNVAKGVKVIRPSRDRAKVVIPTQDELRAVLKHSGANFRPMLLTAIVTGLRSSELRGLRWADVDLKAGTVMVSQRADQWGEIGPPKSKAGYRSIPIGPAIVAELREWRLRCPKGPLGLAFPNSEGGVLHHSNVLNRHYWPSQVRAGVAVPTGKVGEGGEPMMRAKYGLHVLRHAAASAWIRQGVDLKRLTTWMGHSSVQITLDTYGHLIADAAGDADIAAAAQAELLA
jgi:integrase